MLTRLGVAVAGPGPRTLALRLASQVTRPLFEHPQASIVGGPKLRRYQGTQAIQANVEQFDSFPILLPPPVPDRGTHPEFSKLRRAISQYKGEATLKIWSRLIDQSATQIATGEDWQAISDLLQHLSTGKKRWDYGWLAREQPGAYGVLMDMAIESAARDHWRGLHAVLLCLLGSGRPADVSSIFEKYKARKRELEGKDLNDLDSMFREVRLAARLDGEGLQALTLIYITVKTMLDQFDSETIYNLLDTSISFHRVRFEDFLPIWQSLPRSIAKETVHTAREGLKRLNLAIDCHHPGALDKRLNELMLQGRFHIVYMVYRDIMAASIGPNKFIFPRNLDELDDVSSRYRSVPLPPSLWITFLTAFQMMGDVEAISRIVDIEIPARGLKLNSRVLSAAWLRHAQLWRDTKQPKQSREKARAESERLWAKFVDEGFEVTDGSLAHRLGMLEVFGRHQDVHDMYQAAQAGLSGQTGVYTAEAYMTYFLRVGDVNQALSVFSHMIDGNTYRFASPTRRTTTIFLKWVITGNYTLDERRSAIKRFLAIRPADLSLNETTYGLLMNHMIQINSNTHKVVDEIVAGFLATRKKEGLAGVAGWSRVVYALLSRTRMSRNSTLVELQACLRVLEHLTPDSVANASLPRLIGLWNMFLIYVAKSTRISTADRVHLAQAALDIFKEYNGSLPPNLFYTLVETGLNRMDAEGLREAWYWWNHAFQVIEGVGSIWSMVLLKLLRHSETKSTGPLALELIKELIITARERVAEDSWKESREFWDLVNQLEARQYALSQAARDKIAQEELDVEMARLETDEVVDEGVEQISDHALEELVDDGVQEQAAG